jgi:site-specific DNA recombinase
LADRVAVKRCAIYTRKSTEEGLDQVYNTLAAQRDACTAYIASQRHEGWVAIETHYDDGGFSGGTMERPALQALFADLAAGMIDIIVVYKIDRLTRSLADFAKLTELLDKHDVSFVAVTQQFNTSTSMGRLTLNVLLSFAQFEREVAGERIRDKIAASKKRGMWMGGRTPLGYDVKDKKLVINESEAETVRHIYRRYLEVKSVKVLQEDLEQSGFRSKSHVTKVGTPYGGCVMHRGALSSLLTNQTYRGLVCHRGNSYPGEHDAIVPEALFKQVQVTLSGQGPGESAKQKLASPALLKGIVFDAAGNRLQPTHSNKHGRKYRYYVTATTIRDAKANPHGMRIPAPDLESIVIKTVATHLADHKWLTDTFDVHFHVSGLAKFFEAAAALANELQRQPEVSTGILSQVLSRVEVDKKLIKISVDAKHLQLILSTSDEGAAAFTPKEPIVDIRVVGQFLRCGKQVRLVIGNHEDRKSNFDKRLVREIVQSRRWFEELASGRAKGIADLSNKSNCSTAHVSRRISLAFMAPDIVARIMCGTQSLDLTPERLKKACPLPVSWEEQRALLLD